MFLKYLDFLSPSITFFYNGSKSHASSTSGILNIISYIIIIICAGYFLSLLTEKKSPKIFNSNYYNEDAGIFNINSSSLFHFISIETKSRYSKNMGFDFLKFRIIGLERGFESYLYSKNISHFTHWIYGKCKNEDYTKNISGLSNYDFFGESACISKYYDSVVDLYYNVGEPGFKWPKIAHGDYHKNNIAYNIIISRCNKDTLNLILGDEYKCDDDTEFKNFFDVESGKLLNFHFLDNYINILNYKKPYSSFYNTILTQIPTFNEFFVNNLNFERTIVKTSDGMIFENINDNISYTFEDSHLFSQERKNLDGFIGFRLNLKNIGYYYERKYENLADFISKIGGIYSAIHLLFYYLNLHVNNYISIRDMKKTLDNKINKLNKINPNSNRKKIIDDIKYDNSIDDLPSKNDKSDKIKFIKKDEENKKENEKEESITENSSKIFNNTTSINENDYTDQFINSKNWDTQKSKEAENKVINTLNKNNENKKNDHYFNLCNYSFFIITCRKRKKKFDIYNKFRIKVLSEENLVKNYLNLHNLLKATENNEDSKKQDIYQIDDLLNMI